MNQRSLRRALSIARRVVREVRRHQRSAGRSGTSSGRPTSRPPSRGHSGGTRSSGQTHRYPGDFIGTPPMKYDPVADDLADPGEVVWTWVPYEEDHSQGKDRPVLVIGRHDGRLLALQLSSRDHDHDGAQQARQGRYWIDVGTGAWDRQRRPSEARVDRVLQIDPAAVRRIGAVLPRSVFGAVQAEVERRT